MSGDTMLIFHISKHKNTGFFFVNFYKIGEIIPNEEKNSYSDINKLPNI